jgi:hypothetical protein
MTKSIVKSEAIIWLKSAPIVAWVPKNPGCFSHSTIR